MLEEYKQKYTKSIIQYSVIDYNGLVLETDDTLFPNLLQKNIVDIHPFFETLLISLETKDNTVSFSCVHLNIETREIIADIILHTFKDKHPLLIIHDLSDHYNNYQTTAQVRNESVIHSQVLELKNTYLKEKEAFKNIFIANFSHELRDPLTGILTFSEILNKTELNQEQKEYLQILKSSSTFLKKMIDDILDVSKIEAGKLELNVQAFNFLELLNNIRYNYAVKAKQKKLTFNYNFDEKLPEIVGGDAKRLRQVLTNLLDNAIKFTNEGRVTFNVSLNQIRAQKASIHFEITDTGIGIEEEDFETIFNNFTQVSGNENLKGTGLGLPIVKHLVELTNSKISLRSKPGSGSTFSTNINFKANAKLEINKNEDDKKIVFNTSKKYNILLVEDSEITQLSVLKILASQGHFFLDITTNPEDTIARITKYDNEIDLVLLDIKLKQYKGDEIARQIRKLPERHQRKVPIVAMTARAFKEDLKLYKKAGINSVLIKPFNENQLLGKIAEFLN